ncbi:cf4e0a1d-2bb5-4452-8d77-cb42941c7c84 [Thermothielavioides terrestris]|uniref:Cf4e0a1d-2bb5-4452-8d77-cb42941c7c84 n=1 Tax=Thermothielavioides terrestris TaxID=2587410 RepID=A0A446BNJ3_9PEZI|nr:cf4e0a1d-2bb5-4452-8d77-cb42941c7c84 [Thermothielavioides terrestris]
MSYSGSRRSRHSRRRSADHGDDLGSGRELALYNPAGWDVAPYDAAAAPYPNQGPYDAAAAQNPNQGPYDAAAAQNPNQGPYDAAAAEYPNQGATPRPQSPTAAQPSITSSRRRSSSLARIISTTAQLTITTRRAHSPTRTTRYYPPPSRSGRPHRSPSPPRRHRSRPPSPRRHRSRPPSPSRHRSPPPPRRHRSRPPSPRRHRTNTAPTVASGAEYESDGPDYGAIDRHPPPSFRRGPQTRVFVNGCELEPEFRYEIGGTSYPGGAWLWDSRAPANRDSGAGAGAGAGAGDGGGGGGGGSGRHDGGRRSHGERRRR